LDLLKCCPFCEGTAAVYEVDNNGTIEYGVKCCECGASLPLTYELRDFAVMKWNQRGWTAKLIKEERNDYN